MRRRGGLGPPLRNRASLVDVVADTEFLDEGAVLLDVALLDVLQEVTTLTDEMAQATAGGMVLLVGLEVLGELGDAVGQDGNLNLGRSGVVLVLAKLLDELGLLLLADGHCDPPFF